MLYLTCFTVLISVVLAFEKTGSDFKDASLKEFEQRINRLRPSVADVGNELANKDAIPEHRRDKTVVDRDKRHHDNDCCKIGSTMASLGLDCTRNKLHYMTRREKVQAIRFIFRDLDIEINNNTRKSLYTPFRRCVLKKTNQFSKCCVIASRQNNRSLQSNRDVKSRIQYPIADRRSRFNHRFDNSKSRYSNRRLCQHGRCRHDRYESHARRRFSRRLYS